jgi:hypothetical protein
LLLGLPAVAAAGKPLWIMHLMAVRPVPSIGTINRNRMIY